MRIDRSDPGTVGFTLARVRHTQRLAHASGIAIEGGDLQVIDLPNGAKQQPILDAGAFGAALTPDGAELWVVIGKTLRINDHVACTFRTVNLPGVGRRLVFSAEGSTTVITEEGTAIMFVR